ncbi:glycine--tRNA ligase subunit beta [Glaciecola siphonariae]|uniref:Glycine--tRNA ligase beta subunit n=1 Tax=Glaciecola siphonariae TaxID=521012 RepID=A0ABV9LRI6_9ALTE
MALHTLLIELGTEELPPKSLKLLTESFKAGIVDELSKRDFSFEEVFAYGAPRRLALRLTKCQRVQADKELEKRGPAVSAAFDANGEPTKAAAGWARANGIDVSQAQRLVTDKGEWLLHKARVPGLRLDDVIEDVINKALKQLPIPKAMRWGTSDAEFIRPVHTLCLMYGSEILPATVLNIAASNQCSGHRFHGDHRFTLSDADSYEAQLHSQYVIADYEKRMRAIEQQLQAQSSALGLRADYDQTLLEEISSLVEWPVVLEAKFEARFLQVPKEALIYTMKDDQKYVPLLSENGELSETFLFVCNIESKDPSQVIAGNEKVIRPRLADAEFFFESDKKTTLAEKAEKLNDILFQKSLGSIADKSKRVANITQIIGKLMHVDDATLSYAKRAAYLAKADLVSNMVMEFTSVQGIMGRHYAQHDGEADEVAVAIEEQYLPRFANDTLPQSQVGLLLSLAEKLDTLVGIFGVNLIPKGDKDPFALRRSAIGILRMLVTFDVDLNIQSLVESVTEQFAQLLTNKETSEQVSAFLFDRCKPFYADQGISADIVNSVMAVQTSGSFSDINKRVLAVSEFARSQNASSLVAANKRVANILNKNAISFDDIQPIDEALLEQTEEKVLFSAYTLTQASLSGSTNELDHSQALVELSALKEPLDAFFDKVMIMADDEAVKHNRICLIANVRRLFLSVADISVLNI